MEQKTKIKVEDGKQDVVIIREFDLPVELLFKAFVEPNLVEQWMGTKVKKLESKKHGSYQFETTDPKGNKFCFNGVIHGFTSNRKIIRTFEMENTPFGVQLEIYEFEQRSDDTSVLTVHVIYESVGQRDQVLKLPFARGINVAHNRLQEIFSK
jgi:uncharacterized protein YndB with AHSA1/START domain